MTNELKCKRYTGPIYDCERYGFCPWEAEDGNDCRAWCGRKPDPEEQVQGYARSGL